MPSYTRHDFDNMSFSIADDFSAGNTDLNSAVLKMAADKSMNPEQVKRLTEAVNTTVFLKLFKDKPAKDKMVEFDVADPEVVLEKLLGSDSEHKSTLGGGLSIVIKTDSDTNSDTDTSMFFDDIIDEVKTASFSANVKTAGYRDDYTVDRDIHRVGFEKSEKSLNIRNNVHLANRAKDTLLTKQADLNLRTNDAVDEIAQAFKGIYSRPKYAEFELDCLASFGNKCLPGLQMVRSKLGMQKISSALTPEQEFIISDRQVVNSSSNLTKMASIVDNTIECLKINNSLRKL